VSSQNSCTRLLQLWCALTNGDGPREEDSIGVYVVSAIDDEKGLQLEPESAQS
jgi:hypothetical protein